MCMLIRCTWPRRLNWLNITGTIKISTHIATRACVGDIIFFAGKNGKLDVIIRGLLIFCRENNKFNN